MHSTQKSAASSGRSYSTATTANRGKRKVDADEQAALEENMPKGARAEPASILFSIAVDAAAASSSSSAAAAASSEEKTGDYCSKIQFDLKDNYTEQDRILAHGTAKELYNLGCHYEFLCNGLYLSKAEKCFRMAIEKGHADACVKLGQLYHLESLNRPLIAKDLVLAEKSYRMAISKGSSQTWNSTGITSAQYCLNLLLEDKKEIKLRNEKKCNIIAKSLTALGVAPHKIDFAALDLALKLNILEEPSDI